MENMRPCRRDLLMYITGSNKNIAYKSYLPTDLRPFPAVPATCKDADSWPDNCARSTKQLPQITQKGTNY